MVADIREHLDSDTLQKLGYNASGEKEKVDVPSLEKEQTDQYSVTERWSGEYYDIPVPPAPSESELKKTAEELENDIDAQENKLEEEGNISEEEQEAALGAKQGIRVFARELFRPGSPDSKGPKPLLEYAKEGLKKLESLPTFSEVSLKQKTYGISKAMLTALYNNSGIKIGVDLIRAGSAFAVEKTATGKEADITWGGDVYNYVKDKGKVATEKNEIAQVYEQVTQLARDRKKEYESSKLETAKGDDAFQEYVQDVMFEQGVSKEKAEAYALTLYPYTSRVITGRAKSKEYLARVDEAKKQLQQEGLSEDDAEAKAREQVQSKRSPVAQAMIDFKAQLEQATYIPEDEKKQLKRQFGLILSEHRKSTHDTNKKRATQVGATLDAYVRGKVRGTRIIKDAINAPLTAAGLFLGKGAAYAGLSMFERMSDASRTHTQKNMMYEQEDAVLSKTRSTRAETLIHSEEDDIEKRFEKKEVEMMSSHDRARARRKQDVRDPKENEQMVEFVLRDTFKNGSIEMFNSLRGKGKTKESKHKFRDFTEALSKVATAVGMSSTVIESFAVGDVADTGAAIDKFNDALKDAQLYGSDTEKLLDRAERITGVVVDNFKENFSRMFRMPFSAGRLMERMMDNPSETSEQVTERLGEGLGGILPKVAEAHAAPPAEPLTIDSYTDGEQWVVPKQPLSMLDLSVIDSAEKSVAYLKEMYGVEPKSEYSVPEAERIMSLTGKLDASGEPEIAQKLMKTFGADALQSHVERLDTYAQAESADTIISYLNEKEGIGIKTALSSEQKQYIGSTLVELCSLGKVSLAQEIQETFHIEPSDIEVAEIAESSHVETPIPETTDIAETPPEVHTLDTAYTYHIQRGDSLWKSAASLFKEHAHDFGYTEDMGDLDTWVTRKTGNAILDFKNSNKSMLLDDIHVGDTVRVVSNETGTHIEFESSSGKQAETLPPAVIEQDIIHPTEGFEVNEKVHISHTESGISAGIQIELPSGEKYKVYDWDRDGTFDVIQPNGKTVEMSSEELQHTLQEKGVYQEKAKPTVSDEDEPVADLEEIAEESAHQEGLVSTRTSLIKDIEDGVGKGIFNRANEVQAETAVYALAGTYGLDSKEANAFLAWTHKGAHTSDINDYKEFGIVNSKNEFQPEMFEKFIGEFKRSLELDALPQESEGWQPRILDKDTEKPIYGLIKKDTDTGLYTIHEVGGERYSVPEDELHKRMG